MEKIKKLEIGSENFEIVKKIYRKLSWKNYKKIFEEFFIKNEMDFSCFYEFIQKKGFLEKFEEIAKQTKSITKAANEFYPKTTKIKEIPEKLVKNFVDEIFEIILNDLENEK